MMDTGRHGKLRLALAFAVLIVLAAGIALAVGAILQDERDNRSAEAEVESGGLLPISPEWLEYTYGEPGQAVLAVNDFPEKFDLRKEGLVAQVEDQSPFSTCWAFGALGSLESNALMQNDGARAGFSGYSEHHLAWFAYEVQRSGDQEGEGATPANLGTFDPQWSSVYHMAAGSPYLALSTLASWTGAEDQVTVPYVDDRGSTEAGNESWRVAESLRFDARNHLTDVDFLPTPVIEQDGEHVYSQAAVDAVKRSIMENGAVSVSYYADQSVPGEEGNSSYFNRDTWASCVTGVEEFERDFIVPNHVVTIVGWDDAYSKDNYTEGCRPAGDGAWIAKNSWGRGTWGLPDENGEPSGYFYLSYYDETACEFMSFQGDAVEDGFEYERNYQYDYLGMSAMLVDTEYVDGEASTANVFVADGDEELGAVSAVTFRPEASVEVEVYVLGEDAVVPDDGRLVAHTAETFDYGGYHTVELDEPVDLTADERFAVVETIEAPGEDGESVYQVYFENAPADEASSLRWTNLSQLETTARANAGESFRYDEGIGWRDATELDTRACLYDQGIRVKYGNALIKAFANSQDEG